VTYHLTYEDFRKLLDELIGTTEFIEGTSFEARQHVGSAWYERYVRCAGRPVPPTALLSKRPGCTPRPFNSPKHARSFYLWTAKRRYDRVPGYQPAEVMVGKTPGETDLARPREVLVPDLGQENDLGREKDLADEIDVRDALDHLRELIRISFVTRRQNRTEIVATLLAAVDQIEAGDLGLKRGTDRDLVAITDDLLQIRFPNLLGTDDSGKQNRRRVRNDIKRFLSTLDGEIRGLVGVHEAGEQPETSRSEP
jgi:hypothetical protein